MVDLAGKVKNIQVEGTSWEVLLVPTGSQSEEVVKYCASLDKPVLRLHLCRLDCDKKRTSPDLVHLSTVQKIGGGEAVTWESNLEGVDELAGLRAAQEAWPGDRPKEKKEKDDRSTSSSTKKKKKRKEKKKQKKKESKEKEKKLGGKLNAIKPLEALYSGTGLDPLPERRRLLRKRVKKRLKKEKESSSGGSSSTSGEESEHFEMSMLEQRSKIQKISELAPGLLTSEGVQNMKHHVLQANGTPWGIEDTSLPPLVLQYVRQFCLAKASPPLMRELQTLATICDLLLQGRASESIDVAFQRVKSLELSLAGHHWVTAQKVELLRGPDVGIAGRGEVELAQKEARLDLKAKGSASSSEKGGKGKATGKGKEREKGKGKDKAKGSSKEEGKK